MPATRNTVRHRAAQLVSAREQAQVLDSEEDSKAKPPSRTCLVSHQLVEQDGDGALGRATHQVKREAYDNSRQIRANRNECEHCVCSLSLTTRPHLALRIGYLPPLDAFNTIPSIQKPSDYYSSCPRCTMHMYSCTYVLCHPLHIHCVPPLMFPPFSMNASCTCLPVANRPVIPSFKLIHSSKRTNR